MVAKMALGTHGPRVDNLSSMVTVHSEAVSPRSVIIRRSDAPDFGRVARIIPIAIAMIATIALVPVASGFATGGDAPARGTSWMSAPPAASAAPTDVIVRAAPG